MTHTTVDQTLIEHLTDLAQALANAIESGETTQISATQHNLSHTVEALWAKYDSETTSGKYKAVVRLLADMTIHDLPKDIQDPANHPQILRRLRLLKNSLVLL